MFWVCSSREVFLRYCNFSKTLAFTEYKQPTRPNDVRNIHKGKALIQLVYWSVQFDWEKILLMEIKNVSAIDALKVRGQVIFDLNIYNKNHCCDFCCVSLWKTFRLANEKRRGAQAKKPDPEKLVPLLPSLIVDLSGTAALWVEKWKPPPSGQSGSYVSAS